MPTGPSQPLSEWVDKANTICERAIESYQALPDKATIPVMASQVDIGWRKVERLRGLTPPSTERATHKKFVKSIAAQMEAIERRYLLTRNYQSYGRDAFRRQYAVLRKKIGDENERGDARRPARRDGLRSGAVLEALLFVLGLEGLGDLLRGFLLLLGLLLRHFLELRHVALATLALTLFFISHESLLPAASIL